MQSSRGGGRFDLADTGHYEPFRNRTGESGIRAIDHLVLPVTTLTLARSRLTDLGFTVVPDARHPFGTGNCCVFFKNRTYLEPLTIVDRNAADIAASERLVFVRRIKRFTERRGEGFAMVALTSEDAEADHAAFEKAGISDGPVFRFTRNATLPDGEERQIGVALACADLPAAPDAAFFACQHLAKDALFQPQYLEHPNGALGVSAVVAVAERPADFRQLLAELIGEKRIRVEGAELAVDLGGQRLLVMTPESFRSRYNVAPPNPWRGIVLAAFELQVSDMEQAARYAGKTAERQENRIVVPSAPGLGAVIALEKSVNA